MLELPGFPWGCTLDEIRYESGFREEQILEDYAIPTNDETWESWVIVVEGMECYGADTACVQFGFGRRKGGEFALERVEIYYPEGADLEKVVDNMEKFYGPGNTEKPVHYSIRNGELHVLENPKIQQSNPEEREEALWEFYWLSEKKGTQFLSEAERKSLLRYFQIPGEQAVDEEVVAEFIEKEPLVTAICTNKTMKGALDRGESEYISDYGVILDASQLNWLVQMFESPLK